MTAAAGLAAYEVSNHARPGCESRHNLAYWRYCDYSGIGPGAHGRRGALATERYRKPENWMLAVLRDGHGLQSELLLTPRERATEALLMGLRLDQGVDLDRMSARCELDAAAMLDEVVLERLTTLGFVERDGATLRVLPAHIAVLDSILVDLLVA